MFKKPVHRLRRVGDKKKRAVKTARNISERSTEAGVVARIPYARLTQQNMVKAWVVNRFHLFMTNNGAKFFNSYIIATALGSAMAVSPFVGPDVTLEASVRSNYNVYRVLEASAQLTAINVEEFPIEVGIFFTNNVVSVNNTGIANISLNPGAKSKVLGGGVAANSGVYGSLQRMSVSCDVSKMFGGKMALLDDNFCGTTVASGSPTVPTNNVYLNLYGIPLNNGAGGNSFTGAGIQYNLVVRQLILFMEPIAQSS